MKKFFLFALLVSVTVQQADLHAITGELPTLNTSHELKLRLSEEFSNDLITVMENFGDAFNKNTDSFFRQLNESLPKMGKGQIEFGLNAAQSVKPFMNQIIRTALYSGAITLTAYLAQHFGAKYINARLFEPNLIEKRSAGSIMKRLNGWFNPPKAGEVSIEDFMVISDALKTELNYIMKMTRNIKSNGGTFENVLLYGEPGTGKTLFAELLAQQCGMDYAFVPGANVSQFLASGKVVDELNRLFEWANANSKGTIIFFDEAETFLANRSTLPIQAQNALSSFLAKTGTPSNKIMIICATNRPSVLDAAVLSRMPMRVHFPLPDQKARCAQLNMHITKIFENQAGKVIDYTLLQDASFVESMSAQLDGVSGRTIAHLVNRIRQLALAENIDSVTSDLVDRIITQIHTSDSFATSPATTAAA